MRIIWNAMKNIVLYALLGLFLLGVLSGCEREPLYSDDPVEQDVFYEKLTVSYGDDVKTKVFFDDEGAFSWSDGDQISIYTSSGTVKVVSVSGEGETVDVNVPLSYGETRDRYAIYPSSAYGVINSSELRVKYPESYVYSSSKAPTPMVAENSSSSNQLYFKHVGGLLKISVTNIPSGTTELKFVFPCEVTGLYTVTMDSGDPSLAAYSNNKRIVTITDIPESSATLYIPVPTVNLSGYIGVISNVTGTYIKEASVRVEKVVNRKDGKKLTISSFLNKKTYGFLELGYGNANCFIVLPNEESKTIPINLYQVSKSYVRNTTLSNVTILQKPAYCSILWKENGLSFDANIIENNKLVISNVNGVGNAVVAIYSPEKKMLWSYHIWVPGFDPNSDYVEVTRNGYTYQVMRAALGATAPGITEKTPSLLNFEHAGLFYQWGRKDPLGRAGSKTALRNMTGTYPALNRYVTSKTASTAISYDDVGGEANYEYPVLENRRVIKYSILHPSTIIMRDTDYQAYDWICGETMSNHDGKLWQTDYKTIFDPSPEGWQVPNTKMLYGDRSITVTASNYMSYQYNSSTWLYAYFLSDNPLDVYCSFGYLNNHVGWSASRLSIDFNANYWSTGDGDAYGKAFKVSGGSNIYTYWPATGSDVEKESGYMIRCAKLISSPYDDDDD